MHMAAAGAGGREACSGRGAADAAGSDLSELLQPGDPVEFTVAASSQDGVRHKGNRAPKMMAKLVCVPFCTELAGPWQA